MARPGRNIWRVWVTQKWGGEGRVGMRTRDPVRDFVKSLPVLPDIDIEPPAACQRHQWAIHQRSKHAYLYEKFRDVGGNEQTRDESGLHEQCAGPYSDVAPGVQGGRSQPR
jgi:hypothetical protein